MPFIHFVPKTIREFCKFRELPNAEVNKSQYHLGGIHVSMYVLAGAAEIFQQWVGKYYNLCKKSNFLKKI